MKECVKGRMEFVVRSIIILGVVFLSILINTSHGGFACLEHPCIHGICIDDIELNNTHQCYCRNGYTGYNCQINWNECLFSPCMNGGTCLDGVAAFNCSCPENFAGSLCEFDLSDCDEDFCHNNGTCTYNPQINETGLSCLCQPGFSGTQCDEDVSVCNETANICMNGGKCIDGIGDKFSCVCQPGWSGLICEKDINECESHPCQNGGICVDKINDFSCACLFGFTGRTCETKLKECLVNPCQNEGFCLEESGKETCYCVPDYHGIHCEDQYNECDPPPKCFNGGSCIDGVGEFTCSCPPNFYGPTCECNEENSTHPNCQAFTEGPPLISKSTESPEKTNTSILISLTSSSEVEQRTKSIDQSWDQVSPSIQPTYDPGGGDSTTMSIQLSPFPPTSSMHSTITDSQDEETRRYYTSVLDEDSSMILQTSYFFPTESIHISLPLTPIDLSNIPHSQTPVLTPTVQSTTSTFISSDEVEMSESYNFSSTDLSLQSSTIMNESSSGVMEMSRDVEPTNVHSVITITSQRLNMSSWGPAAVVTSTYYQEDLETPIYSTPVVSLSTGLYSSITQSNDINESEGMKGSESESSGVASDYATPVFPTDTTFTPTPFSPITTPSTEKSTERNSSDPCENYCQNDGKCVFHSIEPVCLCPFKFMGDHCEERRKGVKFPSFSGDSFLAFNLRPLGSGGLAVEARFATVSSEGILLSAGNPSEGLYALIYLEAGLVTLHFSCGAQSMRFVETRSRVDNGFNFTLQFRLRFPENNGRKCSGELSVNGSYVMRGDQEIGDSSARVETLYLGGISKNSTRKKDELINILPGFRGCLSHLSINEKEETDMLEAAIDGRDILDCSTLGCHVNPCFGLAECRKSQEFPYWECVCPSGFEGTRCEVRVCSVNPCLNGALCTVKNGVRRNETTRDKPICLCPLGFTGNQCQSELNLTKPAFGHHESDYSSFIAYEPIPRFADWIQLKFHFVTQNMSQIALLMYAGSSPRSENDLSMSQIENPILGMGDATATDFFSISFLQGFVALSWNMGSGTQRITTPARIDNRINVHTLFAGRSGKQAWLKVDGMRNVSGKSPGPLFRLNVDSLIYLGGYEVLHFEGLPHDLSLHKGFNGCIFDFGFRIKNRVLLPKPFKGRNVKNCYEDC